MISTPKIRLGAPGGTRTPTPLRVPDFESGASTGSATGALPVSSSADGSATQTCKQFQRQSSFHELATVAKTDCNAKAVALVDSKSISRCARSWREGWEARPGSMRTEQHFFARPNTDATPIIFTRSLSRIAPVDEKGRGASGELREANETELAAVAGVDRMGTGCRSQAKVVRRWTGGIASP